MAARHRARWSNDMRRRRQDEPVPSTPIAKRPKRKQSSWWAYLGAIGSVVIAVAPDVIPHLQPLISPANQKIAGLVGIVLAAVAARVGRNDGVKSTDELAERLEIQ